MPSIIDTNDSRFSYLPKEVIELQKEILKHPQLLKDLEGCKELADYYATIGVYAEVAIDGLFGPAELRMLTIKLTEKLHAKRTGILFS